MFHVRIASTPLRLENVLHFEHPPSCGAFNLFVGRVRNVDQDKPVLGIYYDIHPTLAQRALENLCNETIKQFGPDLWCYVEHFSGQLNVGGISVLVAVATPHRKASFEACQYLIEGIKRHVPIWKQEYYTEGEPRWLPGQTLRPK